MLHFVVGIVVNNDGGFGLTSFRTVGIQGNEVFSKTVASYGQIVGINSLVELEAKSVFVRGAKSTDNKGGLYLIDIIGLIHLYFKLVINHQVIKVVVAFGRPQIFIGQGTISMSGIKLPVPSTMVTVIVAISQSEF